MASSLKSRRNHYETLGLKPGATDEDIAAAFATESRKIIQNPRVNEPDVREKARQVRTAHQTLRDPVKRAAYDASLGVAAKSPADAPKEAYEHAARPFVAATSGSPDEHISHSPSDAAEARTAQPTRGRRRGSERQPNAATGLPGGLFVAGMAAKSEGHEVGLPRDDRAAENAPEAQAPFVAPESDKPAEPEAADAAANHSPRPEPQHESAAEPAPEPSAERPHRFEDIGPGTGSRYGDRGDRTRNRAAAGGVAALGVAGAIAAFWLWPSEDSAKRGSGTPAGSEMASADGIPPPPDVLDGVPPGQTGSDLNDPLAGTDIADAGSYQSVTFSDSGPIPESSAVSPSGSAPPPAPAVNEPVASSPPAASDQREAAVAAAAAAPSAAGPQTVPTAGAPVAANVPPRIQPAPDLRPATPAKLVRGSILNSDNRRGAYQGTVSVRFTVGTNGRATGCSPTAGSGDPRLDAYTCELVQQRLQFAPAVTARGQPVASEMRATYTWGRKRRTITGRLLDIVR